MTRIYVCVGCGRLDESDRADVLTCSPTCRVKAHRNGSAKALRERAASMDVSPGLVAEGQAVKELLPHRVDDLLFGRLKVEQIRGELRAAFGRRAMQAAQLMAQDAEA